MIVPDRVASVLMFVSGVPPEQAALVLEAREMRRRGLSPCAECGFGTVGHTDLCSQKPQAKTNEVTVMTQRIRKFFTDHRVRKLQRRVDALLLANLKRANALRELNRAYVRLLARNRRLAQEVREWEAAELVQLASAPNDAL